MSNQQWPGDGNPWARQEPNWQPPNFKEHTGRDPMQPFGQQPPAQPPADLEPPRKPVWPWVVGIAAVVVGLLAVLLLQGPATPDPEGSASPSVRPAPSATPTDGGIPYEGNGTGVFTITGHRWTDAGLELDYRITADDGRYRFTFYVFLNETRQSFDPEGTPEVEASPSQPATGTVVVPMPRGDATVVLMTPMGRAITALPVPG